MFLKTLDLIGFKSFADKTHLDFSDGITSLLGPNGCGKSNIVDAIKWVLGEQSTKTLRAGKMEDVIFNGTDTRKPLQMAEVALVINNEGNHLNIDMSEIVSADAMITQAQIKKIKTVATKTNLSIDEARSLLKDRYNKKSTKELLKDEAIDFISFLEKRGDDNE